ncbi:uncharacterized protein ACOB8E_015738 [Sarcophilus harrisii]
MMIRVISSRPRTTFGNPLSHKPWTSFIQTPEKASRIHLPKPYHPRGSYGNRAKGHLPSTSTTLTPPPYRPPPPPCKPISIAFSPGNNPAEQRRRKTLGLPL